MQDLFDMDTHEKIRYISESSNTSGYSTIHHMSPSPSSGLSSPSPAHSPSTILQTEFSNLNLPPNSPQMAMGNVYSNYVNYNQNTMTGNIAVMGNQFASIQPLLSSAPITSGMLQSQTQNKYSAELRIIEQPVEKFRFRYKSEMHGTHGSLNGANSKRTPKTYPEVELVNFDGPAIIRCSLFQTNLDSPHSHQLVVRKDETDVCDPHELKVSPDVGYVAQFQNMGIIHTAKKYIFEELFKKKKNRLLFELERDELSTKQIQELHKATEKEAKDMNLNQVRLCFEAFKIEHNKTWTRIAEPIYSNPINNRKSAQTGELRIVRLSIASGSVCGGDDLILLVEKVSKKNIKVRFFEINDDEDIVWEAFASFREADVHHQYAIVCRTPAYRDKEIDKPVEVNIELVRPSDDERSGPPVIFRYKPKDSVVSRKRRRTCSTATSSSSGSGSGSSIHSFEVPKTVQDAAKTTITQNLIATKHDQTISEEFDKNAFIDCAAFDKVLEADSCELYKMCFESLEFPILSSDGNIEHDGVTEDRRKISMYKKLIETINSTASSSGNNKFSSLDRMAKLFEEARKAPQCTSDFAEQINNIYTKYAEENDDSIIHDIIIKDNVKDGFKLCQILNFFKQTDLFNRVLNSNNESGLHTACLYNHALYIRPLLGFGCNANLQNKHGNTAIHIAVREQYCECVESFLNMKNVNLDLALRNDDGLTPLHIAVRNQNVEIFKKLIDYNPSTVFVQNSKEGNNALHMAVHLQNIDIVQIILNNNNIDKHAILSKRNAAGLRAFDIAKGLKTKKSNHIAYICSLSNESGNLFIKEEEMSSEDDTDDTEDSSLCVDEEKTEENLCELLQNVQKFKKIAKLLNENGKWRELARKRKMETFLCLWSSAEDLLEYVKRSPNIDLKHFVAHLSQVDRDAANVLLTPMK